MSLESIDDVEGCDGLALGVLSICDGVADDALEEGLEDAARLLVDHGRDTLDTATTRETADGGLGDALDVVAENLPVALGTALSKALAALAAWRGESGQHDASRGRIPRGVRGKTRRRECNLRPVMLMDVDGKSVKWLWVLLRLKKQRVG